MLFKFTIISVLFSAKLLISSYSTFYFWRTCTNTSNHHAAMAQSITHPMERS